MQKDELLWQLMISAHNDLKIAQIISPVESECLSFVHWIIFLMKQHEQSIVVSMIWLSHNSWLEVQIIENESYHFYLDFWCTGKKDEAISLKIIFLLCYFEFHL